MFKNIIGGEGKGDIGTSGRLLAGGMAGAVVQIAIYPTDLVKSRLQTIVCEDGKVPSLGKLLKDIRVHEGPRSFYREPGPLVQLSCGTVSGALGATCVYPLQVVRKR